MGKKGKKKSKQVGRHSGSSEVVAFSDMLDAEEELDQRPIIDNEAELLDIEDESSDVEKLSEAEEFACGDEQQRGAAYSAGPQEDTVKETIEVTSQAAPQAEAALVYTSISGAVLPPPGISASVVVSGEDVLKDYYSGSVNGFTGERQDGMLLFAPVEAKDGDQPAAIVKRAQHAAADDKLNKTPSKAKRIILIIVIALVVLLMAAYVAGGIYFSSRFGFGSTIGGVDITGRQVGEVESMVKSQIPTYELSVEARDDFSATIKGTDIEVTYQDSSKELQEILDSQNSWSWPLQLLPKSWQEKLGVKANNVYSCEFASFNPEKLSAVLATFDCFNPEKMKTPVDAKVGYSVTKKKYEVIEEDLGTTLISEAAVLAISDAIVHLEKKVDLDEEECYVAPKVLSTDKSLQVLLAQCEEYFPFAQIYLMGNDEKYVVDGNTFVTWYTMTDEGPTNFNEAAMSQWINDFAARVNTVGATRTFNSMDGNVATVSGGVYGWSLDTSSEYNALIELLNNKQTVEREPYWLDRAASHEAADWGSTYVEVSIASQTLYYVVDGGVAYSCGVVTGNPNNGHATPQGVYYVNSKQSPSTLVGANVKQEDGSYAPEYRTTVSFWMAVIGNSIGIHDATWQPYFGGSLYTYNGSHGCINVSWDSASYLYGVLPVGIPVIIHY